MQTGAKYVGKAIGKGVVFTYEGLTGYDCKRLEKIANNLLPVVREICGSSSKSPSNLSLQKFEDFRKKLMDVNELVEDHKTTSNPVSKIQINWQVKKLEEPINEFIQKDLQIVLALAQEHLSTQMDDVHTLQTHMNDLQINISAQLDIMTGGIETVCERVDDVHTAVVNLGEVVETEVRSIGKVVENETKTIRQEFQKFVSSFEEQQIERLRQNENPGELPSSPTKFLGFSEHIVNLKKILLEEKVNLVGITAMGGAGKSTLAAAICKQEEIRAYFEEMVIYIEDSESRDPLTILNAMWKKIVGMRAIDFTNIGDARKGLQSQIKSRNQPILVVLDDIRSMGHLEKLVFEEKQYTALVTTRNSQVIPNGPNTSIFKLPLLQPEDALSLFCHYAFDQPSIPIDRNKQLVEMVQQKCNGLPLALKVIGSSLYGKPDSDWEEAEKRLLAEESFSDDQSQSLLNKLKTSIDLLKDDERECFLDLGAFPEKKAIPVKALLDIWIYIHGLRSYQAKLRLRKFADHCLLELKKDTGTSEVTDNNMDGYSIFQHGIMRDLALNLANQDNSRRLYMHKIKNHLPSRWMNISSKAHIVSIHTGAMKNSDWPKMKFPEAKALVLYFTASEYCLPTFLSTMKNLKVLIIHNCDGAKRSKLSGVSRFQENSQLKTLHLERLIFPEKCNDLKSLEKINMSLCEGLDRDLKFNFSELLEFNVSYCIDLEELPAGLCSSVRLKRLSVTHCHRLGKLSDQMDKFESLKKIRLFESPSLRTLPSSISNMKYLKYFDISSCIGLKVNRWQHSELKETLQKIARMPSLKRIICDRMNEQLFEKIDRTDLKVEGVDEAEPSLSFLD